MIKLVSIVRSKRWKNNYFVQFHVLQIIELLVAILLPVSV